MKPRRYTSGTFGPMAIIQIDNGPAIARAPLSEPRACENLAALAAQANAAPVLAAMLRRLIAAIDRMPASAVDGIADEAREMLDRIAP